MVTDNCVNSGDTILLCSKQGRQCKSGCMECSRRAWDGLLGYSMGHSSRVWLWDALSMVVWATITMTITVSINANINTMTPFILQQYNAHGAFIGGRGLYDSVRACSFYCCTNTRYDTIDSTGIRLEPPHPPQWWSGGWAIRTLEK